MRAAIIFQFHKGRTVKLDGRKDRIGRETAQQWGSQKASYPILASRRLQISTLITCFPASIFFVLFFTVLLENTSTSPILYDFVCKRTTEEPSCDSANVSFLLFR